MDYNLISHEIPEDITCTHKTSFAGVTTDYHSHGNYEIYLLLNGETNYYFDQHGYHMTRGKGIFIRPAVFHRLEYLSEDIYERINIHIRASYFKTLNMGGTDLGEIIAGGEGSNRGYAVFTLPENQIGPFVKKSHELEKALRMEQYGDEILADCLVRQLLVDINRILRTREQPEAPSISMPPIVSDLTAYIHEQLTNDLSIETLAAIFHHNGHYISMRFKECMGISLQQYIICKRLDAAKQYLSAGYPLIKACEWSGFSDYSNFAKTFTKYTGVSPKKYQKSVLTK